MKEFEKWWKENGCSIIGVKSYSEFIWKAALKWALSKSFNDTFESLHNWIDKEANHKIIAANIIEEELGKQNEKNNL